MKHEGGGRAEQVARARYRSGLRCWRIEAPTWYIRAPCFSAFVRRYTPLPWYRSWAEHQAAEAARIGKEQ